ncbi:MAG: UbiH/UbiF/VisC/COQ6 family ubiquinone biosynthesis hydroxylase [Pseudomonadota bacterium]
MGTNQTEHESDVVIVGAGLIGPALALALVRSGLSITLIDARPVEAALEPNFDGRAFAVARANANLFRHLDLWSELAPHAQPIQDILVTDGIVGKGVSPLHLHFDHREGGDEPLGYLIENRRMRAALYGAMAGEERLEVLAPAEVKALGQGPRGPELEIEREGQRTRLAGQLVVAADGARSSVREAAGIPVVRWSYPQEGLVVTVAHERDHEGIAQEYFLPGGPFAILPLTERRSSLVWTEKTADADRLTALDDAAFQAELEARFGDYLGRLEVVGPRFRYPLSYHIARSFVRDRIALIGDAAHGIHPIAGQGLNLGLKDVAALAEVLIDARELGLDLGSLAVLERYQQWRRFDTVTLGIVTDNLNRLFSNDLAPVRAVRDLGLGIVNQIGPLRRVLMRHAGGEMGDLPRLLQPI